MNFRKTLRIGLMIVSAAVFALTGCGKRPTIEPADGWYSVWAAAATKSGAELSADVSSLGGNTLRQQIMTSIGGDKLKLTFSNEYGETGLTLMSVRVARIINPGSPAIDPATDTAVSFGGKESIAIKAGETLTSDEISFSFDPLDILAVTVECGAVPETVSCQAEPGCTSWIVDGESASSESFNSVRLSSHRFFLTRAETWAPAGTETLMVYGDTVSAGAGATVNVFNSWPEKLSSILRNDQSAKSVSVVNISAPGTGVVGEEAAEKFADALLSTPGVHKVILLAGAEDIPSAQYDNSEDIISGYKSIIKVCHENGISVYGGTLTPFGGNEIYYSELHEKIRQNVNSFIMSVDSGFDGFIDFSTLLCYAEDGSRIQSVYDFGDGLHLNARGLEAMGKAAAEKIISEMSAPAEEK